MAQVTVLPNITIKETVQRTAQRNVALDCAKGSLVMIMVLYHWLNYFVSPQGTFYRYLSFLPPSFIFITGFVVANVYLSREETERSRIARRLFIRGIKLLLVFLTLNITGAIVLRRFPEFCERIAGALLTGSGAVVGRGKAISFVVLIPISYLLLVSAGLVAMFGVRHHAFRVVCAVLVAGTMVSEVFGSAVPNLELLAIGMLGCVIGGASIEIIDTFLGKNTALWICAYMLYVAAIRVWNTPFWLQICGVCLSLGVIYVFGKQQQQRMAVRTMNWLGRYSLFGYIVQIGVLQIMRAVVPQRLRGLALVASFLIACLLTILFVWLLDRSRSRLRAADVLYRAVFA